MKSEEQIKKQIEALRKQELTEGETMRRITYSWICALKWVLDDRQDRPVDFGELTA